LKQHGSVLPHPFQFIVHHHPTIRRYITYALK
jgi:hypothetical protein